MLLTQKFEANLGESFWATRLLANRMGFTIHRVLPQNNFRFLRVRSTYLNALLTNKCVESFSSESATIFLKNIHRFDLTTDETVTYDQGFVFYTVCDKKTIDENVS